MKEVASKPNGASSRNMKQLLNRFDCWLKTYGKWVIPTTALGLLTGMVIDLKLNKDFFGDSFLVSVLIPFGTAVGTVWAALAATRAARLTRDALAYQRERDNELKKPFLRVTDIAHVDGLTITLMLTNLSEHSAHIFHAQRTNLVGNGLGSKHAITLSSNESGAVSFDWSFAANFRFGAAENDGFCDFLFYYGASGPIVHRLRLPFSADATLFTFALDKQTITEEKLWGLMDVISRPVDEPYVRSSEGS